MENNTQEQLELLITEVRETERILERKYSSVLGALRNSQSWMNTKSFRARKRHSIPTIWKGLTVDWDGIYMLYWTFDVFFLDLEHHGQKAFTISRKKFHELLFCIWKMNDYCQHLKGDTKDYFELVTHTTCEILKLMDIKEDEE